MNSCHWRSPSPIKSSSRWRIRESPDQRKLALGRLSALDGYGERKTVVGGNSDNLCALFVAGRATAKPPYLGARKSSVHEPFVKIQFALLVQARGQRLQMLFQLSASHLALKSAAAGLVCSALLREFAPLRADSQHPQHPLRKARVSCHGRPRLSARCAGRNTIATTAHGLSFCSQRPAIGAFKDTQSISSRTPIGASTVYETG